MAATGNLALLGMMLMFLFISSGEAAISCSTVMNNVYPCYNYVMTGGDVPAACCNGIQSLYNAAKTRSDRQSVCSCLKSIASAASGMINMDNVASLPAKCGVPVPYKIGPNMDCSKVPML